MKNDFRPFFLLFTASVRSRPPGPPAVPGVFITEINWSVVQLSLEAVLPFPRSAHNWQSFQETLFYINMCFIIILFPFWKEDDICRNTLMDIFRYIILYYYYEMTCIKCILKCPFICSYLSSSFFYQSSSFLKQDIDLLQCHMAIWQATSCQLCQLRLNHRTDHIYLLLFPI